jgi:hypothetical protein
MNCQELILLAARQARGGLTATESGIWDEDAALQIPDALQALADKCVYDDAKRNMLTKAYTLSFTSGVSSLSGAADLYRSALRHSRFYGNLDTLQQRPFVFRENWATLHLYQSPLRGFYALKGNDIVAYNEDVTVPVDGDCVLYCMYVPSESGGAINIPKELETELADLLAARLIANAATRTYVNAA